MSPCPQWLPMGNTFVKTQDIYQGVTWQYPIAMDIYETRRDNLAKLIEDSFEGRQRRLADAIDRQPDYISRVLGGSKRLGEKLAREIEAKLKLGEGWLDRDNRAPDYTLKPAREPMMVMERQADSCEIMGAGGAPKNRGDDLSLDMFDDELDFIPPPKLWDSKTPLSDDEVEVPFFQEVELAAGMGASRVDEVKGPKLRFSKSTLRRVGVPAEAAACAVVRGNSMEPIMPDGTCVGVNTADKSIKDGEIYVIDHGGMLRVKYLHRRPGGGIKIVSQNSTEHPVEEVPPHEMAESVRIIGRVFWWSVLR